jgi:hypothetical protein
LIFIQVCDPFAVVQDLPWNRTVLFEIGSSLEKPRLLNSFHFLGGNIMKIGRTRLLERKQVVSKTLYLYPNLKIGLVKGSFKTTLFDKFDHELIVSQLIGLQPQPTEPGAIRLIAELEPSSG